MTDNLAEQTVVWQPSPKQALLLGCDDFEVLYGGAAGGGKSDALLIDAWCLQHGGPLNPNHRAVIFRRNYKDLRDLIDRAEVLYPKFIEGAKYNAQELVWETPAGAKLEFGYLENDRDRFKYRGRAWNYIAFEELTTWPTEKCWVYLGTRCRTTDRSLPQYLRATTNPDGPGQRWVMERWGINPEGDATRIEREVNFELADGTFEKRTIVRSFIPALLKDNPHLKGTGYRETLMDMPPEEREALLEGKWTGNRVHGAIYLREMQAVRSQGRIKKSLPILTDVPVNTFWDMGWNDANAVWCHQYAALENRFLHCHQQSGLTLQARVAYLQAWAAEKGVVFGTHYLPHDAEKHSEQTGKSAVQLLREIWPGQRFVVVDRTPSVATAISSQCRPAFANCYFDEEECSDGIAALDAYRWVWSESQQVFTDSPFHGPESNYADAWRGFAQGYAPKQQRIRTPDGDSADTRRRARRKGGSWRSA
ncbi:MAG TPA: terminase family protein [Phycisphaerae bacterium]|nr:terminase family protein [Phycisphaerae bacterium]